ncbi:SDR family NAD(P)-dependent oxidoreductase [Rossellomorea vietnamensis]|uniref:SDR family NAD(P)-dependent oxidoreductase n=1 Tax=Rossellomorea vietnamensis TaxID=218284 RepID=UPI001E496319|nr:SDR family oxidoreductase [Rossellomorea vietnamensis]MCC5801961.1 SDR family oxidoreductase [Rossellomorea vietnamensis]
MNRTVLITGASSGIGLNFCHKFASSGHDVILAARSEGKLLTVAEELKNKYGVNTYVFPTDLSKAGAAKELYEGIKAHGLQVDILINNAGFGLFGEFEETELSKELDMIQVNITALTELSKYVGKEMVSRKHGQILNVASIAAFQPGPLMAVYYATKAYVLSFSEALANEWATHGVKVTALCPGATQTGFSDAAELQSSKLFQSGVMSVEDVVEEGYKQMMTKNKTVIVPGMKNRILTQSIRFMPRKMVTNIVRRVQERV